ncbi:unnamed protein product [Dibothriocephalus latus]|uniref:Uncharacterized protein n=1 Tax=Dibothriocephalus latus TaxID=60516 RepID=A0A3P7MBS4_DIBLA|nr:unnamed protein product [Dibothriocephalus latus]
MGLLFERMADNHTYIAGVSKEFTLVVSEFGIGVSHRPEATIRRQLMQPKDTIPVNQTSGVIYRFDCLFGKTDKRVLKRLHEHELAVRRNEKPS